MTSAAAWTDSTTYGYWDTLAPEGLAWEFLRRNADYRRAFQDRATTAASWGLGRWLPPDLTAADTSVHWSPAISPNELLLSAATIPFQLTPLSIAPVIELDVAEGHFATIGHGPSEVHLSYIDRPAVDSPVCLVIPLDAALPERIEAVRRFWRLLHNAPAPDNRLTDERRSRLRTVARAVDGRAAGATHRQIAEVLYGSGRITDDLWKTSSLRYTTLRRLRDGDELIQGGYRELLHARPVDNRRAAKRLAGVRK